jgi:hypothetical protein
MLGYKLTEDKKKCDIIVLHTFVQNFQQLPYHGILLSLVLPSYKPFHYDFNICFSHSRTFKFGFKIGFNSITHYTPTILDIAKAQSFTT